MHTVSEYYSLLERSEGIGNLEILFMGHFPDSAAAKMENWKRWPLLFEECYAAIEELREQPFRGGPTALIIVDMGQKRFRRKYGIPVPQWTGWFYSMHRLKELPEEAE
jgi:hypothetical protein